MKTIYNNTKKNVEHKLEKKIQFSLSSPFFPQLLCVHICFILSCMSSSESILSYNVYFLLFFATNSLSALALNSHTIGNTIYSTCDYSALKAMEQEEEDCLRYKRDVYKYICPFYRDRGRIMFTFSF